MQNQKVEKILKLFWKAYIILTRILEGINDMIESRLQQLTLASYNGYDCQFNSSNSNSSICYLLLTNGLMYVINV